MPLCSPTSHDDKPDRGARAHERRVFSKEERRSGRHEDNKKNRNGYGRESRARKRSGQMTFSNVFT